MNDEECPICLIDMNEEEGILLLDCCNKKVHLSCIIDWCSTDGNRTNCILCNQKNNFLIDTQNRNSTESFDSNQENNIVTQQHRLIINPRIYFVVCLCFVIICSCIISYLIHL